ncbi:galactan beta-1,4-galactosyltransferase GALS1 [Cucurbita pepo subsp. pepo]|uniref:galactan beta-1,4-galactosyltransferase GALS1 n=1 Tax=Cucurbita pepo subsp. pepo TaxID=3664 RepID=UPI000C9D2EA5|nr:galactan beta-1,4-galactosyltransferase GALS1 [Cucurbita pepo subsp. pepo]
MRKDGPATSIGDAQVGKLFTCFETKPLVATCLALTLVMFLWNLPPYYQNLLFTTARSCSAPTNTTDAALANLTIPPNTSLPFTASAAAKKYSTTLPTDPNNRIFQPFGNAAALFVLMGAYRGGPRTFAVVGLASKPIHVYGHPWYKCEWIFNNGSSIRAKAYKILPDWGYGRVYTVVVVNCTFPLNPNHDNSGGKLTVNAYYGQSQKKYEKFTALEELPGSYNASKFRPPYDYEYLYCGSSLYGNLSAARIREWMAYHAWFFGSKSHFVFHDAGGVSPEVRAVLEPWVRAGRVTIQDIRAQSEYDGYYYNQFLVVNDCLHRYRHAANWTFYFDVDEYIYLPEGSSLESVLEEFSVYTQFTIEQNPMSSMLCLNDSAQNYSRKWGFEKLLFKDIKSGIWRDRKYAIQAKNAYATGVHMSENVIGNTTHKTESKIRYYHYHNSIMVRGELCREFLPNSAIHNVTIFNQAPFVYDDKMKKLADTIKEFERHAIGTANAKLFS